MKTVKEKIQEIKFGVEIEFCGIDRCKAAEVVADVLESEEEYIGGTYKKWEIEHETGTWKIMRDASVEAPDDQKCELVTPPLYYKDIAILQEVIRALRRAGAKVNESCGLHIHIDASEHNAKTIRNLVKMYAKKEDLLYEAFGVYNSRASYYTRKLKDKHPNFVANIDKLKTMDALYKEWYGTDSPMAADIHYSSTRYCGLNLHNIWYRGTIEFRLFNSTLHAGEVRAYVLFCLGLGAKALLARSVSSRKPTAITKWREMHNLLETIGLEASEENKIPRKHLMKRLTRSA